MQISCSICTVLFVASDTTIVGTSCGHLFHHQCLLQWLERSESCPQCRAKCKEKNICRIYFNIHTGPSEDTNTLQNKIDSLDFQLLLKDSELKKCREEIATFQTKSKGLKQEIKRIKGKFNESESNISVLKEQISIMKKRNNELEPILEECERLRQELKFLKNMKTVIDGSAEEVEEMLYDYEGSSASVKSLLTYISVLKKEMQVTAAKKKELSSKLRESESKDFFLSSQIRRLQEALTAQKDRNKLLEKEINHGNDERVGLMQKIQALEQAIVSPTASNPSVSALKRLLAESPAPAVLKRACPEDGAKGELATSPDSAVAPAKEASSYLNIKTSSIGLTPLRPSQTRNLQRNKFSIFHKPHMSMIKGSESLPSEEVYDGMGGHSKPDEFPQPISQMKIKKIDKYQRLSKIKLKDASKSLKMDAFLKKD